MNVLLNLVTAHPFWNIGIAIALLVMLLIKNGAFNLLKFAGGFNIFGAGVFGKLMYYGIFLILAFGLYHQLTRATSDVDYNYKNNVHGNTGVVLDQRQQNEGISCFGISLGQTCLGIAHSVKIPGEVKISTTIKKNDTVKKNTITVNEVKKAVLQKTIKTNIIFKIAWWPFKTVFNLVNKVI